MRVAVYLVPSFSPQIRVDVSTGGTRRLANGFKSCTARQLMHCGQKRHGSTYLTELANYLFTPMCTLLGRK